MNIPLLSQQEQDEANALKWWRETSPAGKYHTWDLIQKLGTRPGDGVNEELISRFAQLGFTHIALLAETTKRSTP